MPEDNKEIIGFTSTALKTIAYHGILFGGLTNQFRVVIGIIGGKEEDKRLQVYESFALNVGSYREAQLESIHYKKWVDIYRNNLKPKKMGVIGWYCSIPGDGTFFNVINERTQARYQRIYSRSIVVAIFPHELISRNYRNFIKIFRLKDSTIDDFSRRNWDRIFYQGLDKDIKNILGEIYQEFEELEAIIYDKHFNSQKLTKRLEKTIFFDFENKKNLINELVKSIEISRDNEYRINKYLTLRLENEQTNIYVRGLYVNQCKYLLLNIPSDEISDFEEIDSIDEASERLDSSLEGIGSRDYKIPPDVEFWGHCSNLQAWYENDYDTRLLHRNLAFPLLKKLTDAGDPIAKKVFKEEIASRYESGIPSVTEYLKIEGYLNYLSKDEREVLK